MTKPLSAKLGIKQGLRGVFINASADEIKNIDTAALTISSRVSGYFDYIHLFAKRQTELAKKFPMLRNHLKPMGVLWISWPKGALKNTDLTLTTIIKIGYDHGLVESKTLSIDATWSAIKFTHPKKDKLYNNKFGKLKT
jgi:hypothetical protein